MIKHINRKMAWEIGLDEITAEWNEESIENAEHHQDGPAREIKPVFIHAVKRYGVPEKYAASIDGEIEGDYEYCTECRQGWIAFAGDIHDDDECAYCGAPRD